MIQISIGLKMTNLIYDYWMNRMRDPEIAYFDASFCGSFYLNVSQKGALKNTKTKAQQENLIFSPKLSKNAEKSQSWDKKEEENQFPQNVRHMPPSKTRKTPPTIWFIKIPTIKPPKWFISKNPKKKKISYSWISIMKRVNKHQKTIIDIKNEFKFITLRT